MANSSYCSACLVSDQLGIILDQDEHPNTFYASLLGLSETSIRRHYKHGPAPRLPEEKEATDTPESKQIMEVVEEKSDGSRSITGYEAIRDRRITLADARNWIRASGDDPEDYILSIKSVAYGNDMFSNGMWARPKVKKVDIEQAIEGEIEIDAVGILARFQYSSARKPFVSGVTDGDGAFVLSINDTQLGKNEGGGSVATLERMNKYTLMAEQRIEELRAAGRKLGTLVILGGGDIVEGCTIYPNQSYNLDLDRRGQINASVAMILSIIDHLARGFDRVIVLAARGNHGENRINGNRTTLYDNDDTLVFEMAKLATDRDDQLSHVEYVIAQDEPGVYVDVAGWRLATTHGDVYGKGVAGATQDKKAHAWFKNMAAGRDPLGLADVLITHHFHHDKMSDWGACLWRQTPAQDGGSEYFRQTTGEYSLPGMLTFVMTPDERYRDEAVLR